jgi:ABC-2 type transport system permease protein
VSLLNLRFILIFSYNYGLKFIKRGPSYLIASLALPLSLLFLIFIISGGRLLPYAIIGGVLSIVTSNAINGAADAAFFRLQIRFQDLFVASPLTKMDYMTALTASYFVFSLPGIILYVALGFIFHILNLLKLIVLILVIFLITISFTNLAFIIAGLLKHIRNVWGITAILSIIATVLTPTFYPYFIIPKNFLMVLLISPITPASIFLQGYFGLAPYDAISIPILIIETIALMIMGNYFIKWRE